MPKRELVLISVSGAHATGKSTLISALRDGDLRPRGFCIVVPSFSQRLWERWQARELKGAPMPVESFDLIDKRGHREWFQRRLLDSFSFEMEAAVLQATNSTKSRVYVLVDRWLPDLMAYTHIGLAGPAHDVSRRQIRRECVDRNRALLESIASAFILTHVTVFIPVASSRFEVKGQDGKFRATSDQTVFEDHCLREWPQIMDRVPSLTLSANALNERVLAVQTAINDSRKSRVRTRTRT